MLAPALQPPDPTPALAPAGRQGLPPAAGVCPHAGRAAVAARAGPAGKPSTDGAGRAEQLEGAATVGCRGVQSPQRALGSAARLPASPATPGAERQPAPDGGGGGGAGGGPSCLQPAAAVNRRHAAGVGGAAVPAHAGVQMWGGGLVAACSSILDAQESAAAPLAPCRPSSLLRWRSSLCGASISPWTQRRCWPQPRLHPPCKGSSKDRVAVWSDAPRMARFVSLIDRVPSVPSTQCDRRSADFIRRLAAHDAGAPQPWAAAPAPHSALGPSVLCK